MIRLSKTDIPHILGKHAAEWTKSLLDKLAQGLQPAKGELSRYSHPEIKAALLAETNGKCAYCESKVQHVAFGDIEHITPKASAPEKRYDWSNLTIACDVCNTKKSDHQDVLDPYTDDPQEHLTFEGPVVWALSALGISTEVRLDLNRMPLIERRQERLKSLQRLIVLATTHSDPNVRNALRRDILENELADDREYTAMCRAVATRRLPAPVTEPVT
jgi:hypothetical protein